MWTNLTKNPINPMMEKPTPTAFAMEVNSLRSGLVHFFTKCMESFANCRRGSMATSLNPSFSPIFFFYVWYLWWGSRECECEGEMYVCVHWHVHGGCKRYEKETNESECFQTLFWFVFLNVRSERKIDAFFTIPAGFSYNSIFHRFHYKQHEHCSI